MTQGSLFDHKAAWKARRAGEEQAQLHLERWRLVVIEQLKIWYLADNVQITADDVIESCGLPALVDGQHTNNGVGALFSAFAKKGYIRPVGYGQSDRVTNHARVLRLWRICEEVLSA